MHKMVKIAVGGRSKLECTETDIVQRLVVDAERLVGVLDKLMHRQCGVVRLDNGVGDLLLRDDSKRS